MPKPRDKEGSAPGDGTEPNRRPRQGISPPREGPGLTPLDLPPFPAHPDLSGAGGPEPGVPDFSIPPFDDLPAFPSLTPDPPDRQRETLDESATPVPESEPPLDSLPPFSLPSSLPSLDPLLPIPPDPYEPSVAEKPPPFENAEASPDSVAPEISLAPELEKESRAYAPPAEPAPTPAPREARTHPFRAAAALIVLGLVLLSWVVKLPDVVTARVTVTGLKSSAPVIPPRDGKLAELFVEEKQHVSRDQIVALIENDANANRVFRIASEIEKLEPFLGDESAFIEIDFHPENNLGSLTDLYNAFHSHYRRHRAALEDDYTEETVASLESQLAGKREKMTHVGSQTDTARREVELAAQKYERMKSLYERRTISVAELQEQERALLVQKRLAAGLAENAVEDRIGLTGIEKEIRDLRRRRTEDLANSRDALRESLRALAGGIEAWEAEFVLRAPEDGIIVFYDYWRDQQRVREGKEAFLIIPESSPLIGRIRLEKERAGKIHDGQEVQIRLDGFPHREYGVVPGTVDSVSAVPLNDAYLVSVKLEYPLVTSEGRALTFKQDLGGDASIFTEEIRLFHRAAHKAAAAASRLTSRAKLDQGS